MIRMFPGHNVKNPPGTVVPDEKLPPRREGPNISFQGLLKCLVKELDGLDTYDECGSRKLFDRDLQKVLDKYRQFC